MDEGGLVALNLINIELDIELVLAALEGIGLVDFSCESIRKRTKSGNKVRV